MRLGIVLRKWRHMFELDMKEVAKEIGISPSTLSRLEGGSMPDGETLSKVLTWLMAADVALKPVAIATLEQPTLTGVGADSD